MVASLAGCRLGRLGASRTVATLAEACDSRPVWDTVWLYLVAFVSDVPLARAVTGLAIRAHLRMPGDAPFQNRNYVATTANSRLLDLGLAPQG